MTISQYDYWYDGVQRRYLEQVVRAFSGFSYQTGLRGDQPAQTIMVPCRMATTNRMVANIIANLSENTLNTVPMITVFQTGLRGRREELQNPNFVDSVQAFERDISNGTYGSNRGNAYAVERLMPLPFQMEVQVDLWTSNLDQKYQLSEQMLTVIYPQFEIQNSENALDWTAVSICFVEDDITFSSRTVPIGSSDEIDIMSIRLRIPIWLSAPAKVRQLKRIEEVVVNVGDKVDTISGPRIGTLFNTTIVTPGDYVIGVDGNTITLLAPEGADTLPDGTVPAWSELLPQYGLFQSGSSELRVFLTDDIEGPFVSGTLQTGTAPNQLLWTIDPDTLPANTLPMITAVIDPMRTYPGTGLPAAAEGTRYLLRSDIGPSIAWGNLTAHTDDIIEYSGSAWNVSFDSRTTATVQYVLNQYTNRQLRWTGREWVMALDSHYGAGYWRLVL